MTRRTTADISGLTRGEWLDLRQSGIGSSDIAAVLDMDPWMSPWELFLDKRGEIPDREPSEAMRIGQAIEGLIADLFRQETGAHVWDPELLYRAPGREWMLCTPDRLIAPFGVWDRTVAARPTDEGPGLLEIKNVSAWKAAEWRDGHVPAHYLCQVQWSYAVTGCQWGYLAALIGGNRLVVREVERDDGLIAWMVEEAAEFWAAVGRGEPPPIDGSESTTALLRQLYAESDPTKSVTFDPELADVVDAYRIAAAGVKGSDADKREAGNIIRAALGDAEVGFLPGQERPAATWKPHSKRDFDLDGFRADYPELAAKYTRTQVVRALRVPQTKGPS